MDELRTHAQEGTLHHAYLIEGMPETVFHTVLDILEEDIGVLTHGNPDVYVTQEETLSIDQARTIKRVASLAPATGDKKFIVVSFFFITTEAQNALLKVLEEPTPSTHFFLITPNAHQLLDTVRSRLYIVKGGMHGVHKDVIHSFLYASPGERMVLIRKMVDAKDRAKAAEFLNTLEQELREKNNLLAVSEGVTIFDEIRQAREHIESQSSSVKMVLEHISLIIPKGGILQTA